MDNPVLSDKLKDTLLDNPHDPIAFFANLPPPQPAPICSDSNCLWKARAEQAEDWLALLEKLDALPHKSGWSISADFQDWRFSERDERWVRLDGVRALLEKAGGK